MLVGSKFSGRILCGAIVAVIALLFISASRATSTQFGPVLNEQFSKVATSVAGRPTLVWCSIPGSEAWGQSEGQVRLKSQTCARLNLLSAGWRPRGSAKRDFAEALGDLLFRVNLSFDLGVTTAACKTVLQVEPVARILFGVGPGYAEELADWFWTAGYYKLWANSKACRPGGALDWRNQSFISGRWPDDLSKG